MIHISSMPSEAEVLGNGLDLGEMDTKLLKKFKN